MRFTHDMFKQGRKMNHIIVPYVHASDLKKYSMQRIFCEEKQFSLSHERKLQYNIPDHTKYTIIEI